jgi:hypothetical protein
MSSTNSVDEAGRHIRVLSKAIDISHGEMKMMNVSMFRRVFPRAFPRVVARMLTGAVLIAGLSVLASAQATIRETPCGVALGGETAPGTVGLTSVDFGAIIYDANQALCWLGDANLAGDPVVREVVKLAPTNPDGSTPVINPDGTMDYQTALNWVNALNEFNHGQGWLNHNNWQLPTNPAHDRTCTSVNNDNFGALCTGGAMGNLYNVGLARTFPNGVVPRFPTFIWPLLNLQPGLYWTRDSSDKSDVTFSFNTGVKGGNTTKYNFFHVLPMSKALLGSVPPGSGVVPYLSGPAAGKAVYDKVTGISWTLNANLPAENNFGVTQTTTITSKVDSSSLTVPLIDENGGVYFSAVDPAATTGWIASMNDSDYAGTQSWELPSESDLANLYDDLGLQAGDLRLEWPLFAGPFWHLQPGFYWACVRAASNLANDGPCDLSQNGPTKPGKAVPMEWSFDFDDGFEGTDSSDKEFYVMVNYPAPSKTP